MRQGELVMSELERDGLLSRYEELRNAVLGSSVTSCRGLLLFLDHGMLEWLKAWLKYVPSIISAGTQRRETHSRRNVSADRRAEVAKMLANMAIGAWEETMIQ